MTAHKVIVAVNDDVYIRHTKKRKPQQCQEHRIEIMASIKGVNHALGFKGDDPSELIASIEPDVLAVGSDYHETDIKGLDIIKGYGGRVLFVEREPISSSGILRSK